MFTWGVGAEDTVAGFGHERAFAIQLLCAKSLYLVIPLCTFDHHEKTFL